MLQRNVVHFLLLGAVATGAFALGRFWPRPASAALASPMPRAEVKSNNPSAASGTSRPERASDTSREQRLAAAIESAHHAPDRPSRLYRFALSLRDLDAAHYPAMLKTLQRSRAPDTPELIAMLCSVWATHDGPAAFAATRALIVTDGEYQALHGAIVAWARREPAAARAALHGAGFTDMASDEMAALLQGWASGDPAAAEAYLLTASKTTLTSDGELSAAAGRGFEAIAGARIEVDPAAAMEWYGRLGVPLKERLRQSVLSKLAAVDPNLASQWLARDDSAQVGAGDLIPVLRGLQLDGFDRQFRWAATAANPVTRESALTAVVQEGAHANLLTLGEWLAARADDTSLTPAFSAYALQVVRKSPNAAVIWAMSLDQPEQRQRALNTVAAEWITVNPRAAREWAQRTGLVNWDALVR